MAKILKSKKGFTLVELIVCMVVLSVITTTVAALLGPMLSFYARANDLAESNTLVDNIANYIISDLSHATAPIPDSAIDRDNGNNLGITVNYPGDVVFAVDAAGVLTRNNSRVLSKDFYKNKSVSITTGPGDSSGVYLLTVTITLDRDNDREMVSRVYAVRPLALPENQFHPAASPLP